MSLVLNDIYEVAVSMSVELFFGICFAIAFAVLRGDFSKLSIRTKDPKASIKTPQVFKKVHTEATAGNSANAVAAWRALQAQAKTPCDTIKIVAQTFLDTEPSALVSEIVDHLALHTPKVSTNKAAMAAAVSVLEVVARSGKESIMEELFQEYVQTLHISPELYMQEVLLGGHAAAGNTGKVEKLVAQLRERQEKLTARGYCLMIKGFLKSGMLDAALAQVKELQAQGLSMPSGAVLELFRIARDIGRMSEIFHLISSEVPMTCETFAVVAEGCAKSQDVALATAMEKLARQSKVQMNFGTYESLLKLYTSVSDMYAVELFKEMQGRFAYLSDGLLASLIARCAEPKFLRLADEIVAFVRSKKTMTIMMYSALMKVYSHCNMASQACDLYAQIRSEGLEPDSVMVGCLMKFSAACGRTELTNELAKRMPALDIHHYMAFIRAASQDKDVDKAFSLLEDIKNSGMPVDAVVYNAVLDVCSSASDMQKARSLINDMKERGMLDIVSYNTLLKGYCVQGDLRSARECVAEMEAAGFPPNDISYNCIINVAASSGNFAAAWEAVETMQRKDIRIDSYTVSTMMKALKHAHTPKDAVGRVMSLLDRHGIDVWSEEILLNTVVEACIKHYEHRRLNTILASFDSKKSGMTLAAHTYATLIRAAGVLKRMPRCRELWIEMTERRGLEPNDVALGCMLEALVSNGGVTEAVTLLRRWQDRVPVNTVLYSTLIKGFVQNRDTERADEMWREFRTKDLPLNTMIYNAIIDAHARVGNMGKVKALVELMRKDGLTPDDITLSMLAKAHSFVGELEKAIDVFHQLPSGPNAGVVYNTILDGCVRHNGFDLADTLIANMEKFQIQATNHTLCIIVKMWGQRSQMDRAFAAFETLPKQYGFVANGPVQTCLLFACLRNFCLEQAIEVYQGIRRSGNPTDGKMFTALIGNCVRASSYKRAVPLVEDAYGLGGARRAMAPGDELDSTCLEKLFKLISKRKVMDTVGVPLLTKMQEAKVPNTGRLLKNVTNKEIV